MIILNQLPGEIGRQFGEALTGRFPQVRIVDVPAAGAIPPSVRGDLLIANHRSENMDDLVDRVPWIHFVGTGVDGASASIFDCPTLTCSRGASNIPMAEYVMLALLAFEKRVDELWSEAALDCWSGLELGSLYERRVGFIGFGETNRAVARLLQPFDAEMRAYRRNKGSEEEGGVTFVDSLKSLMAWADHLVCAVPETPLTHRMLNAESLGWVKHGVHIVNIGRGTLIDYDALRAALDDGRVGFVTTDVTDPEPLPRDHWMATHDKVRVSPHVSWSCPQVYGNVISSAVENVRRHLAGEPLKGVVDKDSGY